MSGIREKAIEICVDKLGDSNRKAIENGTPFLQFADSLDLVELTMELEEKMGITISDEDALKLTNLPAVVEYLEKHQK